jgi:DNA polymerase-3 subunit beta
LASLHKIDSDPSKKIKITITENQIVFEFNQTTLLSRLVSGTFPNYKRVIPEKTDFSITANTADLLTSTKRAALCVGDRGGTVSYLLNEETLKISATSSYSEYDDELPVKYSGGKFNMAFNPAFMVEALKRIDSESVRMSFTTPSNPVRIEPEKGKDYFFIVMPMRVEAPV